MQNHVDVAVQHRLRFEGIELLLGCTTVATWAGAGSVTRNLLPSPGELLLTEQLRRWRAMYAVLPGNAAWYGAGLARYYLKRLAPGCRCWCIDGGRAGKR